MDERLRVKDAGWLAHAGTAIRLCRKCVMADGNCQEWKTELSWASLLLWSHGNSSTLKSFQPPRVRPPPPVPSNSCRSCIILTRNIDKKVQSESETNGFFFVLFWFGFFFFQSYLSQPKVVRAHGHMFWSKWAFLLNWNEKLTSQSVRFLPQSTHEPGD